MNSSVLDTSAVVEERIVEDQKAVELVGRELVEAELLFAGGGTGEVTW